MIIINARIPVCMEPRSSKVKYQPETHTLSDVPGLTWQWWFTFLQLSCFRICQAWDLKSSLQEGAVIWSQKMDFTRYTFSCVTLNTGHWHKVGHFLLTLLNAHWCTTARFIFEANSYSLILFQSRRRSSLSARKGKAFQCHSRELSRGAQSLNVNLILIPWQRCINNDYLCSAKACLLLSQAGTFTSYFFKRWRVIQGYGLPPAHLVIYQTDGAGDIRRNSFICSEARMEKQPALVRDFSGTQFLW